MVSLKMYSNSPFTPHLPLTSLASEEGNHAPLHWLPTQSRLTHQLGYMMYGVAPRPVLAISNPSILAMRTCKGRPGISGSNTVETTEGFTIMEL